MAKKIIEKPIMPIVSLPPIKEKEIMDHSGEFSKKGFGPYPPATKLRAVSGFDAKNLKRQYLEEIDGGALRANSRFTKFTKAIEKESKNGEQNGFALIELGDKILESDQGKYSKEILVEEVIKGLFLIEGLEPQTAAAFLVRAEDAFTGAGGDVTCTVGELVMNPKEYLKDTDSLGEMLKYLLASMETEGEKGEFAREWEKKMLDAECIKDVLEEIGEILIIVERGDKDE